MQNHLYFNGQTIMNYADAGTFEDSWKMKDCAAEARKKKDILRTVQKIMRTF